MNISVGIVGLPNVGKSTLFNALAQKSVPAENYPFCTIDPSVGVVPVPDERLEKLVSLSKSEKVIPAVIEFVDIAGLVQGASRGEGLGNNFLSNIREVDTILHLVRVFDIKDDTATEQVHVYGDIDPIRDIEVIMMELILADMQTLQNRRAKLFRDVRLGNKDAIAIDLICEKLHQTLDTSKTARTLELSDTDAALASGLHLLTMKPIIFGFNIKSGGKNLSADEVSFQKIKKHIQEKYVSDFVILDAHSESDLTSSFSDLSERESIRSSLLADSADTGIPTLIRKCYELLGLITFFTTGPDETRAWTINRGDTAPVAGAAIHNDFQNKFIRAQVVSYDDLVTDGNFTAARSAGHLRTEGKEYVVRDGDVVEFLI